MTLSRVLVDVDVNGYSRFEKEALPLARVEMLWMVILTFSPLKSGY